MLFKKTKKKTNYTTFANSIWILLAHILRFNIKIIDFSIKLVLFSLDIFENDASSVVAADKNRTLFDPNAFISNQVDMILISHAWYQLEPDTNCREDLTRSFQAL